VELAEERPFSRCCFPFEMEIKTDKGEIEMIFRGQANCYLYTKNAALCDVIHI
jgi:hypothetical protein